VTGGTTASVAGVMPTISTTAAAAAANAPTALGQLRRRATEVGLVLRSASSSRS
jgi:hypothetical protein